MLIMPFWIFSDSETPVETKILFFTVNYDIIYINLMIIYVTYDII